MKWTGYAMILAFVISLFVITMVKSTSDTVHDNSEILEKTTSPKSVEVKFRRKYKADYTVDYYYEEGCVEGTIHRFFTNGYQAGVTQVMKMYETEIPIVFNGDVVVGKLITSAPIPCEDDKL